MIIGNILWKQHKLSNILQKYWQIIPSRTVTLYISEIEISLLTKIFLNLSIILKMNIFRYLTLLVYKGSVDCQWRPRSGEFLFSENWAEPELVEHVLLKQVALNLDVTEKPAFSSCFTWKLTFYIWAIVLKNEW